MLVILPCLALVLNVFGQENNETQSYDPSKLLSQIFNLEQNDAISRNMLYFDQNNFKPHEGSIALSSSNKFKKNNKQKPRRLNPNGFYGNPHQNNYIQNYNTGHFYERPSFATEALSRVTEALTSIALYDDFQCVPRLLCEAAGGGLGSSNVLQSVAGLQPLMTLLSAYSGISSNPLFFFGRAVLLGMSSKENPASCRYGYPLCPTDPEQLVHYLNNHNGGFFRFFNAPQKGQNIQQFYNHLQGNPQNGNYGLYQPNRPETGFNPHQQNIGPQNQGYGFQRPYEQYQQNYGLAFPYGENFRIQKRIQNNPNANNAYNTDIYSKWIFPDNIDDIENENVENDNRRGKELKFPENSNYVSTENHETSFTFPNTNRGVEYINYNNDELYRKYNDYKVNYENNDKYNDFVTVYVVRGNGDPNKPEIVKLRPGQSL